MKVCIALLLVYLIWGSTYLGMKIAVETILPFLMAGIRFLVAGGILYTLGRVTGGKAPTMVQWRSTAIVGALLLFTGNGLVAWAELRVSSGIASLLIATTPLWMMLYTCLGKDKGKPTKGILIGMLLGFGGILLLVMGSGNGATTGGGDIIGMVVLILASFSWASGSVYAKKAEMPDSPLMANGMEMLAGGVMLLLFSMVLGDWLNLEIALISRRSLLALGYLILFGSIVAFSAYIWLLRNADITLTSTYAFVNPIVAVALGWFVEKEALTLNTLLAAALIVVAVVLITLCRPKAKSVETTESPNGFSN